MSDLDEKNKENPINESENDRDFSETLKPRDEELQTKFNGDNQNSEANRNVDKLEDEEVAPDGVFNGTKNELEVAKNELEVAKSQLAEHVDKLTRAQADMENMKRRHLKELENAHKFGNEKFANELLSIWDSLELGLAAASTENSNASSIREGIELTLKMLKDVMESFGVAQIDPVGQIFDPELHQAISTEIKENCEANNVLSVVQKGYILNGRLIRPAMVVVSQ